MVPRTGVWLRCAALSFARGAFFCARRFLVGSVVAARAGCACRNTQVSLWPGVLAGYSTGGLAHPRHFGVFDRKQVA